MDSESLSSGVPAAGRVVGGRRKGVAWVRSWWPELLVLALATLVRFWRLDYHSFWFDETVSLDWAEDDPLYIWNSTFPLLKDKHPPGYYLLLHVWREGLAFFELQHHEVALRALGALLGVLTVAGLLLLTRQLGARRTSLLAGLLAALAPILVWYSQELRMFQPAATFLVWAAFFLLRGWMGASFARRLGWWAALIAALTLALYSYLFSAFALPAAGLTLLCLLFTDRRFQREARRLGRPGALWRRFSEGVAALAITTVIFLPLARNAWLVNDSEGEPGQAFMFFWQNMQRQLQIFTVWRVDWPWWLVTAALVLLAGLLAAGVLVPGQRGGHGTRNSAPVLEQLWLATWIGVPLLIGNVLLAKSDTVFAEDRYFVFLAPFVLWAIARGVVALVTGVGPSGYGAALLAVILVAAGLPRLWTPAMFREDWRAVGQYIAAYQARSPGLPAAAVAHVDYTYKAVRWYLPEELRGDALPVFALFGSTLSVEQVDDVVAPPLRGIKEAGFATLWLVQSHLEGVDDGRVVEGWLDGVYPVLTEQFPTGIKLTGYALHTHFEVLPPLAEGAAMPEAELVPNLRLAACEVVTPMVAATDERLHPPSGWVHVRLWWQPVGPVGEDYAPSVQVVGPDGIWGERLVREGELMQRVPTSTWTGDDFVRDEVDINLNPATPAGEYGIMVGLRGADGVETGTKIECGRVHVR